jgi:hypothetical protein
MYDLELDSNDKILVGERHTKLHPDFLWTPGIGATTEVNNEEALAAWSPANSLPSSWRILANQKAKTGHVMSKIINSLVEASRAGN